MTFEGATYIILDLPPEPTAIVQRIRRFYDPARAKLEAEVSLTGSSGLGSLTPGQDPVAVFAEIDRIAAETPFIQSGFCGIGHFPKTGIYYFMMQNPAEFIAAHLRFWNSSILFEPNCYHYKPHCTLTLSVTPLPPIDAATLQRFPIPQLKFTITTMSLYELDPEGLSPKLLHRTFLKNAN